MKTLQNMINLEGKRGIILGVANHQSIAYGCASTLSQLGAKFILTYASEKAQRYVEPIKGEFVDVELVQCDVSDDSQVEALFNHYDNLWEDLDFIIHSIAFAPKQDLQGRVVDCSRDGFLQAMDISCHSFMRLAKYAESRMKHGGCLLTMSYYGSEKVVEHYNLMGPVKAALEASVRYMAAELGDKGIRVHAISPGPLKTRAASGIDHFDDLLNDAANRAPQRHLVSIDDVGHLSAFLISDAAVSLTGQTNYVDCGYHIIA